MIESARKPNTFPLTVKVEMRGLFEGVNAGVGPAASRDGNGLAGKARQGGFDFALHGPSFGLYLPAAVRRADIVELEPIAHNVTLTRR